MPKACVSGVAPSLQTSQEARSNHTHLCYQDVPKKITLQNDCKILGMTVSRQGIYVVALLGGTLRVGRMDMLSGKISEGGKFPDIQVQHFAKQPSCTLYKLVCQSP